jgi:hypothetical protein
MKVASKLVKMDFVIGKIERKDQYLIIHSHPESTMPAKVRIDAIDLWSFIRAMLNWPVISYILTSPVLYRKAKAERKKKQ